MVDNDFHSEGKKASNDFQVLCKFSPDWTLIIATSCILIHALKLQSLPISEKEDVIFSLKKNFWVGGVGQAEKQVFFIWIPN